MLRQIIEQHQHIDWICTKQKLGAIRLAETRLLLMQQINSFRYQATAAWKFLGSILTVHGKVQTTFYFIVLDLKQKISKITFVLVSRETGTVKYAQDGSAKKKTIAPSSCNNPGSAKAISVIRYWLSCMVQPIQSSTLPIWRLVSDLYSCWDTTPTPWLPYSTLQTKAIWCQIPT